MAEFLITLNDGSRLVYATDPAHMTHENGERVDLSRFKFEYKSGDFSSGGQAAFSPDAPIIGKTSPRILKIQLGLGCNFACSYCSQGGQKENASSSEDAHEFSLDWVEHAPEKVEFWGGEPLLYWKKLQILVEKINAKWPEVRKSLVTNGTLLTKDKVDWLFENGFSVAISHDGPGQHLRGDDPLKNQHTLAVWRYLFSKFGERAAINSVLTAENHDLAVLLFWFHDHFKNVRVNVEDIVTDYGGASMSDAQLQAVYESVKKHTSTGLAFVFPRIKWAMLQFMATLANEKPLDGSNQVCGMDRQDQIAVDLHGNVLTCQNAGAESGHKIGTTEDLSSVRLNTSTSYMQRESCRKCPVVHLCYGSCMFLSGKDFESSCRSSFWYNRAILDGVVRLLTGKEVVSVSGWVPKKSSIQSIQVKAI